MKTTKVKIRKWKKMEKEFGLDTAGNIQLPYDKLYYCNPLFTRDMKYLCGKVNTVKQDMEGYWYTEHSWGRYYIYPQMVVKRHRHLLEDR